MARAEQVWRKNVEKREQFVYEHKGAASMHMYSGFGRTQSTSCTTSLSDLRLT